MDSFNTAIMLFFMVANYEDTDIMIEWQHEAIKYFERPEYSLLKALFCYKFVYFVSLKKKRIIYHKINVMFM